jgi:hypothetical protein
VPKQSDLRELESIIRSAGEFVRPSDGLRSRTLEGASEQFADRELDRKLRRVAIMMVLGFLLSLPLVYFLQQYQKRFTGIASEEGHSRGLEQSSGQQRAP